MKFPLGKTPGPRKRILLLLLAGCGASLSLVGVASAEASASQAAASAPAEVCRIHGKTIAVWEKPPKRAYTVLKKWNVC